MGHVHVVVAMVLALALAQDKPGQERPGGDDLDSALSKAGMMNNYTATLTLRKEGGEPGTDSNHTVDFRMMPGAAYHLKAGELEGYRQGEAFVVKEGGAWKRVETGAAGEPADKGQLSAEKLAQVRAPHEFLRELKTASFKSVRREDGEGGRIFSGDLTDQAIRALFGRKGGSGDARTQTAATGNARIWLNAEGVVSKFELTVEHKDATGKAGAESSRKTKIVEFREIGSTKYEVPADAMKVLGGRAADKGEKPMDEPKEKK